MAGLTSKNNEPKKKMQPYKSDKILFKSQSKQKNSCLDTAEYNFQSKEHLQDPKLNVDKNGFVYEKSDQIIKFDASVNKKDLQPDDKVYHRKASTGQETHILKEITKKRDSFVKVDDNFELMKNSSLKPFDHDNGSNSMNSRRFIKPNFKIQNGDSSSEISPKKNDGGQTP